MRIDVRGRGRRAEVRRRRGRADAVRHDEAGPGARDGGGAVLDRGLRLGARRPGAAETQSHAGRAREGPMPNRYPKCEICLYRHAPGNCKGDAGEREIVERMAIQCHSMPGIVADLARICGELAVLVGKLPCVENAKQEVSGREGIERTAPRR